MIRWTRRATLAAFAALAPARALAEHFAGTYTPQPQAIGDGVWLVRGTDAAIAYANGGAIANSVILSSDAGPILIDPGPSQRAALALAHAAQTLTGKPPALVIVTHLHPDHALGASAFDPAIVAALPGTIAQIEHDGPGMADGMFRILADWMRGTRFVVPAQRLQPGPFRFGGRSLTLFELAGHSACDLALRDDATGVLIAGDLVFHDRAPATPHANLAQWHTALDTLEKLPHRVLVPGHGPLDPDGRAIAQTRDWLTWLDTALHDAANQGQDMVEAGMIAIPPRFVAMAAARYELQRSVSHFWPAIDDTALPRIDG